MSRGSESTTAYDLAAIQKRGCASELGRVVQYYDAVDSTNATAVSLAQRGASHGTVVLADAQHAGRGRHGRAWHSPPGRHLYCSVIIRPDADQSDGCTLIPLASALAVSDAIKELAGVPCQLKWPNDVLSGDKKLAGILCESVGGQAGPVVVVGIGINVNGWVSDFPAELRDTAGTIMEQRGRPVDRTLLLMALLNRLAVWLKLVSAQGRAELLAAYRRRCATLGRHVKAVLGEADSVSGIAEAISTDGSLSIRPMSAGSADDLGLITVRSADIVHLERITMMKAGKDRPSHAPRR